MNILNWHRPRIDSDISKKICEKFLYASNKMRITGKKIDTILKQNF